MPNESTDHEVDTYNCSTYHYKVLICVTNLTDDKTFELWDRIFALAKIICLLYWIGCVYQF